ncbi:MAG: LysR substrate-binding domain-containing protein, partial [Myxococcota bacterium]
MRPSSEDLQRFAVVVRAGSFAAAAVRLQTHSTYLGRVVARLEKQLGVRLLQRTTRSMALTDEGRLIFEHAERIERAVAEVVRIGEVVRGRPVGTLRITAGQEFGERAVNLWIASFLDQEPDVRVEVEFTNRVVELVGEGFDLAVRVGALPESDLVARRLGRVVYGTFAAPGLDISDVAVLRETSLVVSRQTYGRTGWRLEGPGGVEQVAGAVRYRASNHGAALAVAASGLGVTVAPVFMAREHVSAGR